MRDRAAAYLWDALLAAREIEIFVDGKVLADYIASPLLQAAVERKFEVIGEALNQLSKHNPEIANNISQLRQIVAFRNILIHGYAVIDPKRVWAIAFSDLPALIEELDMQHEMLRRE
jgi:uncharacterized protein with HEPN domain